MPIDLFEKTYFEEYNITLTKLNFSEISTYLIKEIMKQWFLKRYCDPNETTPYDSREGGYQYILGGPFDALETLSDQFSDLVSDELLRRERGTEVYDWVYTDAFFQYQE
jgi:hypothetical protein